LAARHEARRPRREGAGMKGGARLDADHPQVLFCGLLDFCYVFDIKMYAVRSCLLGSSEGPTSNNCVHANVLKKRGKTVLFFLLFLYDTCYSLITRVNL